MKAAELERGVARAVVELQVAAEDPVVEVEEMMEGGVAEAALLAMRTRARDESGMDEGRRRRCGAAREERVGRRLCT